MKMMALKIAQYVFVQQHRKQKGWLWVWGLSTFSLVVLCSLLTTGCGTAGFCIVDVESASVIFRREGRTFRESPQSVMQDGIMTLQRTETNSFVLRKVGFDGKDIGRICLPLFTTAYGTESYSFSEDGKRLAYVKQINDLKSQIFVVSTTNFMENLLPAGVCENLHTRLVSIIVWVNADSFLLFPNGGHREDKEPIWLIHLDDRSATQLDKTHNSYGPISLSPSKRYLLASDEIEDTLLYRLLVFDLESQKRTFMIEPSGRNMHAWGAVWSSDDELVYAVDNVVYAQKVGSSEIKEIFKLNPSYGAWLYAVDSKHNLHYQIFERDDGRSRQIGGWRTFNLDSKMDKELTGHRIYGKVRMARERDKIVAEVGY